jgi:uncharacterized protein (DUF924 family)
MTSPDEVLAFWLDEVGPKGWYGGGEALDAEVRRRYQDLWQAATEGACALWLTYPSGTLAYIVVTDQFPRNMFRDDARAFSTDTIARAAAKVAVDRGWDLRIDEPARQFFYMPMMHSENLSDQDRCVRLMLARMPRTGANNLLHAKAHREVIRRFGRFPTRNAALGRTSNAGEQAYLDDGGYLAVVRALEAA